MARPESRDYDQGGREPDPTDFFIRIMKRLAVIGLERMEIVHARSQAERDAETPAPRGTQDRTDLEYQRITRAMRLCAALAMKFHNDRLERDLKQAVENAEVMRKRRSRRRNLVERLVKAAIDHEADERDAACADDDEEDDADSAVDDGFNEFILKQTLSERLDEEDIERDLERCPISELVGRICRGFGIKPDWRLWEGEFWALEEARCRPPGSPYPVPPAPPDAVEPEDPRPPDAEAKEPEPEAPKPAMASPEGPVAPPIDPRLTPEYQRALREREERAIAKYNSSLSIYS